MDDLISRQAAIEAIEEYADRLQMVNWKEYPNVPYKAYALNWCINTIRDLPSAQTEQRWIPVSERLPEYGIQVLTTDKDGDFELNHIIDEDDEEWFFDGAIAWCELPEPWKGDSDG